MTGVTGKGEKCPNARGRLDVHPVGGIMASTRRLEVCLLGVVQIRPREAEQSSVGHGPYTNDQFQPGGDGVLPAATIAGGC